MQELIAQGAEAKIYRSGNKIIKDRISKSYRLPQIDTRLRTLRTKAEARLISRAARAGVPVPQVLEQGKTTLEIEFLDGPKLRDWIDSQTDAGVMEQVLREVGKLTAKLHSASVIHGDLTTSNIIVRREPLDVCRDIKFHQRWREPDATANGSQQTENCRLITYFIDFGLGTFSNRLEDKAVDIHLFKECLKSKHYPHWRALWQAFRDGYKDEKVFEQLEKVEARGRYKQVS